MTIWYCRPRLTTDGAGTSSDPFQPSQVAANLASGDTVRFLYDPLTIGGFTDSGFKDTTIEIGTFTAPGVTDVVFETAPGEPELARITGTYAALGTGQWTLVNTATKTYQQIIAATGVDDVTKCVQDVYGELGPVTGEGDGPRRRHLHKVPIADDSDAAKAALDSDEGAFGVTEFVPGAFYRLVVHCWGDVDPRLLGVGFIRYSLKRTATGLHRKGALSFIECRNITIRNIEFDGFFDGPLAAAVAVQTVFPATNGVHPGLITIDNVRARDCSGGGVAVNNSSEEPGNEVKITNSILGGFGTDDGAKIVDIGNLIGASKFDAVELTDCDIYPHTILGPNGASALTEPTSGERIGVRAAGQNLGSGIDNVFIDQCNIRGVVGASAVVVGFDVRSGTKPAPGSEWSYSAYGARMDRSTCEGVPQIFFDHTMAVRRSRFDLGNSVDATPTSTGPVDIGSNAVDALWLHCKWKLDSSNANEAIGMSENARLRIGACSIAHASNTATHPVFLRGSGINNRTQLIGLHNSVVRSLVLGQKLADMGSTGSVTDLSVQNSLFDGFVDDTAWYVSSGVSVDKAGFAALNGVTGAVFDINALFEADEVTPSPGSYVLTVMHPNPLLQGEPAFDPGTFFNGRLGPVQDGTGSGGSGGVFRGMNQTVGV